LTLRPIFAKILSVKQVEKWPIQKQAARQD
jgi:hypothetical protein